MDALAQAALAPSPIRRPDLGITPEYLRTHVAWMVLRDGVPAGWGALAAWGRHCRLEHLWIEPDQQFQGLGRRLLDHLAAGAWAAGWMELEIFSEPRAVGFYERCGAVQVGEHRSPDGVCLPRLLLHRGPVAGGTTSPGSPRERCSVPEEPAGQGL